MEIEGSSVSYQTKIEFVDSLVKQLQSEGMNEVSLVAVVGSGLEKDNGSNPFSDLDLMVIFEKNSEDDPSNSKRYLSLIETIKNIQKTYAKKGVYFCIFPTFRVQEFTRFLAYDRYRRDYVLVHLLVYPSVDSFVNWEHPSIVETMCATAKVALGDKRVLEKARQRVKRVSFKERIEFLLSLLYETHRFLECSLVPEEVRVTETIHMLEYIFQYLSGEILRERGYNVNEAYDWRIITKKIDAFGPRYEKLMKSVRSSKMKERKTSLEQVHNMCLQLFDCFNEVLTTK